MLEPSRSVIFQLYSDAGRGAAGWDDTGESRETQGGILPGQTGFTTVSCVCWNHHVLWYFSYIVTPDGEQQAGMTPEKVEKLKEASFQVRQALQQFPVYVGTITFCDISAI